MLLLPSEQRANGHELLYYLLEWVMFMTVKNPTELCCNITLPDIG